MLIRTATLADSDAIRKVYLSAFDASESDINADLAISLLSEPVDEQIISLLAHRDGQVVGHVCFSPVYVADQADWLGYLLAPLAVMATAQQAGVGSQLVRTGLAQLAAREVNVVLVYGDPAYYGRFGFDVAAAANYLPPCPLTYPHGWQMIVLRQHAVHHADAGVRIQCVPSMSDPALW